MSADVDVRAAGTPAMVPQAEDSVEIVWVTGVTQKANGGEDRSDPGASRGVDHQGSCIVFKINTNLNL